MMIILPYPVYHIVIGLNFFSFLIFHEKSLCCKEKSCFEPVVFFTGIKYYYEDVRVSNNRQGREECSAVLFLLYYGRACLTG